MPCSIPIGGREAHWNAGGQGEELRSDKSRILSATVYVTDMALKPEMDEAWMAWVDQSRPPARATVEARLGANVLVEIMITAAKK